MNSFDPGKYPKAGVRRRVNWVVVCRVSHVLLNIWMAVLVVWIALTPGSAQASQALRLSLAISETASAGWWYHPGVPPSDGTGRAGPQPDISEAMYLPDLRTRPLSDLYIQLLSGGRRSLRLENTIWNSGQGPLELTGEFNPATRRTRVLQHIYTAEGDRRDILVGEFVWHPTHDHWHFDELTLYELWILKPDYSLGEVVTSSDKLSYCMRDTDAVDRDHPRFSPRRSYWSCGQRLQGLSVGWGDTYKSTFDGQALDLSGLRDGFYALTSSVNPNAVIIEEDYSNNTALVYLEIVGDRLMVVTLKQIRMAVCDETLCKGS